MNSLAGKTVPTIGLPEPKPEVVSTCEGPVTEWTWDSAARRQEPSTSIVSESSLFVLLNMSLSPPGSVRWPAEYTIGRSSSTHTKEAGATASPSASHPAAKVGAVRLRSLSAGVWGLPVAPSRRHLTWCCCRQTPAPWAPDMAPTAQRRRWRLHLGRLWLGPWKPAWPRALGGHRCGPGARLHSWLRTALAGRPRGGDFPFPSLAEFPEESITLSWTQGRQNLFE